MKFLPIVALLAPLSSAWMMHFYTDESCNELTASFADIELENDKYYPIEGYQDPVKAIIFDKEGGSVTATLLTHGGKLDGSESPLSHHCFAPGGVTSMEYALHFPWY